jgi:hypothetical protein
VAEIHQGYVTGVIQQTDTLIDVLLDGLFANYLLAANRMAYSIAC